MPELKARVSREFQKRFKAAALERDLTVQQAIIESIERSFFVEPPANAPSGVVNHTSGVGVPVPTSGGIADLFDLSHNKSTREILDRWIEALIKVLQSGDTEAIRALSFWLETVQLKFASGGASGGSSDTVSESQEEEHDLAKEIDELLESGREDRTRGGGADTASGKRRDRRKRPA